MSCEESTLAALLLTLLLHVDNALPDAILENGHSFEVFNGVTQLSLELGVGLQSCCTVSHFFTYHVSIDLIQLKLAIVQ